MPGRNGRHRGRSGPGGPAVLAGLVLCAAGGPSAAQPAAQADTVGQGASHDESNPDETGLAAALQILAPVSEPPPGPQAATGAIPVLTPIEGPLTLDGRYLGDLSGEVGLQGGGVVDAARLLQLLEPVVSPQVFEVVRDRVGGQLRIDMQQVSSDELSLEFDTFSLSFVLRLDPTGRSRRTVSFNESQTINPAAFDQPARFSAGANVTLGQRYNHDRNEFLPAIGGVDLSANLGGFGGPTFTMGLNYDGSSDDGGWRRREARVTKDIFRSAIRLTGGEFAPPVDAFQGSGRILGVSAARAYSTIRPFQNIRPSGRREFVLDQKSFVVVEVSGVVVQRLELDPGPYALSDFPFGQGASTVRLLIEDPTGRREIAVFDLFGGGGLLDKGIIDFAASVGVLEEGGEFEYGSTPAASAFVRAGVADRLTLGLNGQTANGRWQLGGAATYGSRFGLTQLSGAGSYDDETSRSGFAASIDYLKEFSLRQVNDLRITVSAQSLSRDFQTAFQAAVDNPVAWQAAAQAQLNVQRFTFNIGAAFLAGRDEAPDQRSANLTIGRSFGRLGLSASLGWRSAERDDDEVRFGFSLTSNLGERWSAAARYENLTELREIGLSRSSNGELGDLSGNVRVSQAPGNTTLSGDLNYINNRFDGQVTYNRLISSETDGTSSQESFWRLSSFVGFADGAFGVGRPATEAFVIARKHRSLRASRLALTDGSGRDIARSGWFGPAVAGVSRAYGVSRFEVEVDPLPAGYDLGAGVLNTFPGFGNGYAMTVGSDASRTVLGVLVGPQGPLSLVSGTLELEGDGPKVSRQFFTNRSGRFVGDGLAPGRYRIVIKGRDIASFAVGEEQEGIVDVGRIQAVAP